MEQEFTIPPATLRKNFWETFSRQYQVDSKVDFASLAVKFRFSPGQIKDSMANAEYLALYRSNQPGSIEMSDLYTACHNQSNQKLSILARKIKPKYQWEDIVLPPDQLEQLREICSQVKYRQVVYGEWGFDRKLSLGKGLTALFSGSPGTGKTMAAEVIANDLYLELYKIDLSQVVSKYIGETEKNLEKIFTEAETSNAILFFDEADALFGKRSEVKDAHDRYANIETGYLLQRMEEYEGIVILATNLNKNMDEAFLRRLNFVIEFPFPDTKHREILWRKIFPEDTPRNPDLDYLFLAEKLNIAGGNIKNIALNSAFYAAGEADAITMKHIILATKREYRKIGKSFLKSDFEPYYQLIKEK
jgi:SpoVK/Ycf46/Vps4 family AAA+-type ATPase